MKHITTIPALEKATERKLLRRDGAGHAGDRPEMSPPGRGMVDMGPAKEDSVFGFGAIPSCPRSRFLQTVVLLHALTITAVAAEGVGRAGAIELAPALGSERAATDLQGDDVVVVAANDGAAAEPSAQVNFFKRTPLDLWGVISSPGQWNGRDWAIAGLCVVGTAATGYWVDSVFQDESQETRSPNRDRWSKSVGQLGTISSFAVLGGVGAYGWLGDDRRGVDAMVDGLEATIIASGIITPVIKYSVGRSRPSKTARDADVFAPFSGEQSFPSGHATQAFTVATTIAGSFPDDPWLGGVAYTLAAGVALSRINDNAHYASDVVAGAIIGSYVGHQVVKANRQRRAGDDRRSRMTWDVLIDREAQALELAWRW